MTSLETPYFEQEKAIARFAAGKTEAVLEVIANRYIAANPPYDYTARPYTVAGIVRNSNYRYDADFSAIFPDAPDGSYVYLCGRYHAAEDGSLKFVLIPRGPAKVWINGELVFASTVEDERYDGTVIPVALPVKKGANSLILRFTRTKAGFGGEFGTWLGKLDYYFFRGNSPAGAPEMEGVDYTLPLETPFANPTFASILPLCTPLPQWTDAEKAVGCFGRVLGLLPSKKAVARTSVYAAMEARCVLSGTQSGKCAVYVNGIKVLASSGAGSFHEECVLNAGTNHIAVVSECPETGASWDLTLEMSDTSGQFPLSFVNPFFGASGEGSFPWVYAGPFEKTFGEALLEFDRERLIGQGDEQTWWRLDIPGGWMRLYNENPLYGHWNYPLGVTLYGLIETARYFDKTGKTNSIADYVGKHVAKSLRTMDYALFDKAHFGGSTAVHHLLTSLDSLDDCGSFGSTVLEIAQDMDVGDYQKVADYVASHILRKQDRLPGGVFYRKQQMHHFHNGTMWADDLYMSVPFLCRYARLKGDSSILDDAVVQFEGFKKHLFMEEKNVMAHVYDFKRGMNTGIPWGRGNGWTIFSLSELLMVLPKEHGKREFLLDFFRILASGYLACQDESGLWHQVLNMSSSYPETSCTAMFIASFSRGLQYGWFQGDETPYRIAAEKAWNALTETAIDRDGNIYGVCRGSEFAFTPRYYAEHLLPRLNDTHGIGIVLLAGVELLNLRAFFKRNVCPPG